MTERGPRTLDVAEEVKELAQEVRDLRNEMNSGMVNLRNEMNSGMADLRAGLREVKTDLRWIKGIGAAILAGSGWVIWNAATVTGEVRHQGAQLEKVEKRQDASAEKVDAKLDAILRRIEAKPEAKPKAEGNSSSSKQPTAPCWRCDPSRSAPSSRGRFIARSLTRPARPTIGPNTSDGRTR